MVRIATGFFLGLMLIWFSGFFVLIYRFIQAQRQVFTFFLKRESMHFIRGDPRQSIWFLQRPQDIPRLIRLFYTHQEHPEVEKARQYMWLQFLLAILWAVSGAIVIAIILRK